MHKKSSFIKTNKFVPLLSDVLPYEAPIKFSNVDLYKQLKNEYNESLAKYHKSKAQGVEENSNSIKNIEEFFIASYIPEEISKIIDKKYTVPYKYFIKHGVNNYRQMSLLHPYSQCQICDFYEENKTSILYNTSKSSFSLRFPYKIARFAHRDLPDKKISLLKAFAEAQNSQTADIQEDIIEDCQISNNLQDLISNFFVYKKYSHLFKFYKSQEYLNYEKKFLYLTKLDISHFFNSIYTHSIAWAVKSKKYTKEHLNNSEYSFAGKFDKLMRFSNYNETNGIPIGAEVSRIFAEIIMQSLDLSIEKQLIDLKYENKIKIRRYVDDYFIFYNDKNVADKVIEILKEKLLEYNFNINDSKTINITRPFITKQTIAKEKIRILLNEFLDFYESTDLDNIEIKKEFKTASWFLTKYRILIAEVDSSTSELCNFLLSAIQKKLIFVFKKILQNKISNKESMKNILKSIINVMFYIYVVSENASATFKLYKIIIFIIEISKRIDEEVMCNELKDNILQEILLTIENISNKENKILVEQLDILNALKIVESKHYRLSESKIKKLFKFSEETKCLSYFEIVEILDYIQNDAQYQNLKKTVIEIVKDKLKNNNLNDAECFLLLFDLIKCPYVDEIDKKDILSIFIIDKNKERQKGKINNTLKKIYDKNWFYNWKQKISLKNLLEVKEYTQSYF